MSEAPALINLAMFVKCCRDFGLLGELLSGAHVISIFKQLAPPKPALPQLDERGFGECLAECAHQALARPPYSTKYPEKAQRANALFRRCGPPRRAVCALAVPPFRFRTPC